MSVHPRVRSLGVSVAALALVVAALPGPTAAAGGIYFDGSPGTGDPPSTLGPYAMTSFGPDGYSLDMIVSSVPAPGGGVLGFGQTQGVQASSLSKGFPASYTGHVYTAPGYTPPTTFVLTLPSDTRAFYLYADVFKCGAWTITATAQDGTTSGPVPVTTSCGTVSAKYFGFYSTGASPIVNVTLATSDTSGLGYWIGRFGIYRATPALTPVVSSFSPMSGRVGATVTIYGSNFSYASRVTFNGRSAAFSVRSPTTIVATVPLGATTGPIAVTTSSGTGTSANKFYVLP